MVVYGCNGSTVEAEMEGFLGASLSASLILWVPSKLSERPCGKKERMKERGVVQENCNLSIMF